MDFEIPDIIESWRTDNSLSYMIFDNSIFMLLVCGISERIIFVKLWYNRTCVYIYGIGTAEKTL